MRILARPLLVALAALMFVAVPLEALAGGKGGSVSVKGYTRKDGTYVAPHTRSAPDSNPHNNYSMPGNYNPNTGTITSGDANKYLDRYYEKQGGRIPLPKTGTDD